MTTGVSSAAPAPSSAASGTSSMMRTSRLAFALDPSLSVTVTAKLSITLSSPAAGWVSVLSSSTYS